MAAGARVWWSEKAGAYASWVLILGRGRVRTMRHQRFGVGDVFRKRTMTLCDLVPDDLFGVRSLFEEVADCRRPVECKCMVG